MNRWRDRITLWLRFVGRVIPAGVGRWSPRLAWTLATILANPRRCAGCEHPMPAHPQGWQVSARIILCPGCASRLTDEDFYELGDTLRPYTRGT